MLHHCPQLCGRRFQPQSGQQSEVPSHWTYCRLLSVPLWHRIRTYLDTSRNGATGTLSHLPYRSSRLWPVSSRCWTVAKFLGSSGPSLLRRSIRWTMSGTDRGHICRYVEPLNNEHILRLPAFRAVRGYRTWSTGRWANRRIEQRLALDAVRLRHPLRCRACPHHWHQ